MSGARSSSVDAALGRRIRDLPHASGSDRVLEAASRAVEHAALWLCCCGAGMLFDRARRRDWARAAVAVAATEATSQAIKRAVRRERPPDPVVAPGARFSFPSAHTASTVAAALSFPRGPHAAWAPLVAVTAFSRPYLGVHYPSDVIAGAAVGWAVGVRVARAGRAGGRSRLHRRAPAQRTQHRSKHWQSGR